MAQIGSTILTLSAPFLSISSSLDNILSMGRKMIVDVEVIKENNKLVEVSREINNAMKIIEEREKSVQEREDNMKKVEREFKKKMKREKKELKTREENLATRTTEMNGRERKLHKKEKRMEDSEIVQRLKKQENELNKRENKLNERENELNAREKEIIERYKPREMAEEKMKDNVRQSPQIIKIHIGVDVFLVERSTILKYPDSILNVMLTSGKFKEGELAFIDRDPSYFPVILNFMRGYVRPQDTQLLELDQVKREFDFYLENANFLSLEKTLSPFIRTISGWIPKIKIGYLLYKASRDGRSAQVFHQLCDNKGPTLCIIQSKGYLFGGYAADSWRTERLKQFNNRNTFVFTLSNPHKIPPTQYFLKKRDTDAVSMTCHSIYGIWFGGKGETGEEEITVKDETVIVSFPLSFEDTTGKGSLTFTGNGGSQPFDDIFVFLAM